MRAIQFLNDDVLILMSTKTIEDIDEYSEYINNHANSLADQLQAKADIDIDPNFTIIIISKEKLSVILNAVNCAFMGRWPD
mgnify:CR=1 FL=1